jgi:PadR family transcriptional regulator PadR
MEERDLCSGLIRLHILHRADREEIFGNRVLEDLAEHGYRLSAGTLYPILHALTAKGYLRVTERRSGSRMRKMYRTTSSGRRALVDAKAKVETLFAELFEQPKRRRSTNTHT